MIDVVVLVMTDGRAECISQTLASARENLHGARWARFVIHDDSGDRTYRQWLEERWPEAEIIGRGRAGFGGAIARAWQHLSRTAEADQARFVFHLEDDFLFRRPVRLDSLAMILDAHRELVQLALRRQPWSTEERKAGGVVELHPEAYFERSDGGFSWLEQRLFFTTNPSLYRRSLCARGWPSVEHSEGVFSHQLMQDPHVRFGYWGSRASGEWVEHIGRQRAGEGY